MDIYLFSASNTDQRPIILTAMMDEAAQVFFDDQRSRYFPQARNWLKAHITLFHVVPGKCLEPVQKQLQDAANSQCAIHAVASGIRKLGSGTAYDITCQDLCDFRNQLSKEWADWLTPQDRQKFKPHVTVQNKVSASEAHALADTLKASFKPFEFSITGIAVWRYDGGPWEPVSTHYFSNRSVQR